jgi:hypothetical protein
LVAPVVVVGHENHYGCVCDADAEVMQAAAVAQGELPNWSTVSWRMRKCSGFQRLGQPGCL